MIKSTNKNQTPPGEKPRHPLPSNTFQPHLSDPQMFQAREDAQSLQRVLSLHKAWPKGRHSGGNRIRCPAHLNWLLSIRRITLQKKFILASCIWDLVLLVMVKTSWPGEGWNVDSQVNKKLCLSTQLCLQHDWPKQQPHYWWSIDSSLALSSHHSWTRSPVPLNPPPEAKTPKWFIRMYQYSRSIESPSI